MNCICSKSYVQTWACLSGGFFLFFFMYGNFNAQEEHKGWTIAQSANLEVLPTKEKNIQQSKKCTTKQELA